ncbi:MAG: Mur ligase family protein, partial [Pseudobdellovibrionaceae bacterium]
VGKSTVSALMGFAFEGLQEQALVCGNFGIPLADYAADILENKTLQRKKYLVIELSSYQLENCHGLKLNCSALVSLTPNHLERYKTQFYYYTTKLQIFNITSGEKFCACESAGLFSFFEELAQGKHQDVFKEFGYSNLNFLKHIRIAGSSEHLVNLEKKYSSDNSCYFDLERSFQLNLPEAKQHRLIGHHNKMNILLCMALFRSLGFEDTADTYLKNYGGLPHRLENLGEKSGVTFINDSKATTLESVITAAHTLEQFYPKRRAFLLVGGKDKNLPWQELGQLRKTHELNFIFFGACGSLAREKSQLKGHLTPTLATGLNHLKTFLKVGDVVLLSPGGTSLDEFKNFEDRGLFFKSWVNQFNL